MPKPKRKPGKRSSSPVTVDDLEPRKDPKAGVIRVPEPGGPVPIPYPTINNK